MNSSICSSDWTLGARLHFAPAVAVKGGLREYLARQTHAGAHFFPVLRSAHVIETGCVGDPGSGRLRNRTQPRLCERMGPMCDLEAVFLGEARTVVAHGHGQEVVLEVGIADSGTAADECAGLEVVAGTEPVVAQEPAQPIRNRLSGLSAE